jgi:hypothetical protein
LALFQDEALWSLANIAAGEKRHTAAVVSGGAVLPVLAIFHGQNKQLRDEVLTAVPT